MFTGARVIVKSNKDPDKGFFGIVTGNTGREMLHVKFDDGKDHVIRPNRCQLVYYFKQRKAAVSLNKVDVLPNQNVSGKQYFTAPKAVVYDETLVNCLWLWANKEVFGEELKPIEIVVAARPYTVVPKLRADSKAEGVYFPVMPRKNPKSILAISKSLTTIERVTEVTVHEMVHQYNFEIDLPAGRFNLSTMDPHGKIFLRFAPKVKDLAGVDLKKYINMQEFNLGEIDERDEKFHNTKIKKYYILVVVQQGRTYAGKYSNLDAAINKYQKMRLNPLIGSIYSSTNAELYHSIKGAQVKDTLFAIEPKVIENIKKFATKE